MQIPDLPIPLLLAYHFRYLRSTAASFGGKLTMTSPPCASNSARREAERGFPSSTPDQSMDGKRDETRWTRCPAGRAFG